MAKKHSSSLPLFLGLLSIIVAIAAVIFMVTSPAFYYVYRIGNVSYTESTPVNWSVVLFGSSSDSRYETLSPLGLIGWILLMVGALTTLIGLFVGRKIRKAALIIAGLFLIAGAVLTFLAPSNLLQINNNKNCSIKLDWGTYVSGILAGIAGLTSLGAAVKA